MDDTPARTETAPTGWPEALAESEAEAEAGLFVPGEVVRQDLRDSIARMQAKRADARKAASAGGASA